MRHKSKTAASANPAPKKNGADAPHPAQTPTPCHNNPAISEAGRAVIPMAALNHP